MMNLKIFLACTVVILSLDQTIARPSPSLQQSILSLIDAMLAAGKTPVNLTKTIVQGAIGVTNAALESAVKAESELLDGSVQTFKHGVDSASNLIKIVQLPGLEPVVDTGSKAINLMADLKNLVGQASLNAKDYIIKVTTDTIGNIVEAKASLVGDIMENAANMAKKGVNQGFKLVDDTAQKWQIVDVGLDQLSSVVNFITRQFNKSK